MPSCLPFLGSILDIEEDSCEVRLRDAVAWGPGEKVTACRRRERDGYRTISGLICLEPWWCKSTNSCGRLLRKESTKCGREWAIQQMSISVATRKKLFFSQECVRLH